jgi:hypothetical protein
VLIAVLAAGGAMAALPAAAAAQAEVFHRFEAEATANFTVTEPCADGSTSRLLVTVIGGIEEETGEPASEFVTVLIRGTGCDGVFVNDRGSGPAEFSFSPSLQEAGVTGTITTRDGREVTVDVRWEGAGKLETTSNATVFPGFAGQFRGAERDATATGTVVVDGELLVDGSTDNASIETLEDTNVTTGAAT